MDGWEATAQILSKDRTRHIPVIALTAHALESDRRKSVAVGCVDFETKPVSLPDLIAKIERHVAKPAGRSEEHTSELQSLMRLSYAVFCLKKKNTTDYHHERMNIP